MEQSTGTQTLPPPPVIPGAMTPDRLLSGEGGSTVGQQMPPRPDVVQSAVAAVDKSDPIPEIEQGADVTVKLPAGLLKDEQLITRATVRELNGFDEEKLSRIDMGDNYAKYITKMLELGVEDLGGVKPDADTLRSLLSGDRDSLVIGIRKATYGVEYSFEFMCPKCDHRSKIGIDLDKDVPVTELEDPKKRDFEVPGTAKRIQVKLIDGFAQEIFTQEIDKKTAAEVSTATLAQCVIAINGNLVQGRQNDVLALSVKDRGAILDFLREHQPGPQITEIPIMCATCETEYPYRLGLGDLFRF